MPHCDRCFTVGNPDQSDFDNDFEGDICDLDDGLIWITLPDAFTGAWQQEVGIDWFNAYRGNLAVLNASGLYTQNPSTVPLASRECGLASSEIFDVLDLAPGQVVFYLVSGIAGGVEESLGTNSGGRGTIERESLPVEYLAVIVL